MNVYVFDISLDRERAAKLDPFTLAYISAAFWLLTDEDGESLDYLGLHDLSDKAYAEMAQECADFQAVHADLLEGLDPAQCGHDFWLTRNRHGAGFWDRGYGDVGDKLTDVCHAYGESDLYLGGDGEVYVS